MPGSVSRIVPTQGPRHQSSAPGRAARSARSVGSAMTVSPSQFGNRTRTRSIARRGIALAFTAASPRPPPAPRRRRGPAARPATHRVNGLRHAADRPSPVVRGPRAARAGRAAPTWAGAPHRPGAALPGDRWSPACPAVSGAPHPSPSSPGGSRPPPGPAGPRLRDHAARTRGDPEKPRHPGRLHPGRSESPRAVPAPQSRRRREPLGPRGPTRDEARPIPGPRGPRPRSPPPDRAPAPRSAESPRGDRRGSAGHRPGSR